jgi:hypothetical protein
LLTISFSWRSGPRRQTRYYAFDNSGILRAFTRMALYLNTANCITLNKFRACALFHISPGFIGGADPGGEDIFSLPEQPDQALSMVMLPSLAEVANTLAICGFFPLVLGCGRGV